MSWAEDNMFDGYDPSDDANDYDGIDGRIVKETQRAYLVMKSDLTEVWVPKSVSQEDGSGGLVVQNWFIEKEGLDQ